MRASLTTRYLGLRLKNPVVASAGPLTGDLDTLCELEQAGVAAAVLPSLFEEQISRDEQRVHLLYEHQSFSSAESLSYFPRIDDYNVGPREYLKLLEKAKKSVSIPVIGSLNGSSPGGWVRYAKLIQEAGADAIELNIYFVPTDPDMSPEDVEWRYVDLVATVHDVVSIPVAVKIGAQFTNLSNFIPRLAQAGAKGVVLFNRYLEPDIDLDTLQITPRLVLSNRSELRLPLRWIAILRDQVSISLAATSGIHQPEDVIKLLLVGADACMITSTLLRHGVEYVGEMLKAIQDWLDANEYESVEQLKGSMSYGNCPDSGNLERANYMKAIVSYTAAYTA
ncbi:MAG: dihydroorotate dehydrogenase-like protein [Pirellulales bacterium]